MRAQTFPWLSFKAKVKMENKIAGVNPEKSPTI